MEFDGEGDTACTAVEGVQEQCLSDHIVVGEVRSRDQIKEQVHELHMLCLRECAVRGQQFGDGHGNVSEEGRAISGRRRFVLLD